ncbi:hypothetical protein B0J11DRAFT_426125 [Dendryphion nanum]|uniref:FAD-binding domain-containing protein n=1 Tax=Dendryphion nanum TaxID=256645 RepID=A0A9P9EAV2_9PLEO|nr:hypothetical protein B0J11DRAFT_426125 [Dendryphion nanum]
MTPSATLPQQNGTQTHNDLPDYFSSSPQTPLNITIVGAGIGGLSAAILLRHCGHHITILEQSRFANELGAAVHLAPNANGILRRMGLFAENIGANPALGFSQFFPDGREMFAVDLTKSAQIWQHPWLLAHRVHLHSELKRLATATEGKGAPVELRTSARVVDVETNAGIVVLESGEKIQSDLVLGADGVHSRTRAKIPGAEGIKTFGSGKSAWRFLISRKMVLEDPETKRFAEKEGHLSMFMARDRRVVIYPTSDNTLLNFVCIHPTAESEVQRGNGWSQTADKAKLLEVYRDFNPALVKLLSMADEETLKVWELLDMENLPAWSVGRLAVLGDAAHPFTPHQGQGAGQAIEDAASLAVMFPLGTSVDEIPERLKLYEKCRYERASRIQEYSRIVGRDLGDGPTLDANEYTAYNFGHDEWHHSSQVLHNYLASKMPNLYIRNPISFGPMPGPRQDHFGHSRNNSLTRFTTASVRFKTSRTLLQNFFPNGEWKFTSPGTLAEASWSVTTLSEVEWLGGKGYTHFGLYIHGVEHKTIDGEVLKGTFLPVLFENLADPIVSGREELGMPKVWSELNVVENLGDHGDWKMDAGWLKERFCDIDIQGLEEVGVEQQSVKDIPANNSGLLWYKSIPATSAALSSSGKKNGDFRGVDAAYAVFLPDSSETQFEKKVERTWIGKSGTVVWNSLDWKKLPTLHHIVGRLEEIPVFGVVESKVVMGTGGSDVRGARRV